MPTGDPSSVDPRRLAMLFGLPAKDREWQEAELSTLLKLQLSVQVECPPTGPILRTLGEILTDPRPPVEMLERIKNSAKAARQLPGGPLPEPVVSVIYFASISAALARCARRISSLNDSVLRDGIRWALARTWLDPALRPVLEEADRSLKAGEGRAPTG